LSQRGLLDPINPACIDQYAASFINFLHYCSPSLDFMVQGKMTEADILTVRFDATPSAPSMPPTLPPFFFTSNALSAATLPINPGLGQAQNNAGLHNHAWLHSQLLD